MLGDEGIIAFTDSIDSTTTIEALGIEHCNIHARGASSLIDSVCSGPLRVKALYLSNNPLGPDGMQAIVRSFSSDTCSVQILSLRHCDLTSTPSPIQARNLKVTPMSIHGVARPHALVKSLATIVLQSFTSMATVSMERTFMCYLWRCIGVIP